MGQIKQTELTKQGKRVKQTEQNKRQKHLAQEASTVHNPVDASYKSLLQTKKAFVQLLRYFLKEQWVEQVDEQRVQRIDKSFVLPNFAKREADLVYKCRMKGNDVFFYVLVELQSTVDQQMP